MIVVVTISHKASCHLFGLSDLEWYTVIHNKVEYGCFHGGRTVSLFIRIKRPRKKNITPNLRLIAVNFMQIRFLCPFSHSGYHTKSTSLE